MPVVISASATAPQPTVTLAPTPIRVAPLNPKRGSKKNPARKHPHTAPSVFTVYSEPIRSPSVFCSDTTARDNSGRVAPMSDTGRISRRSDSAPRSPMPAPRETDKALISPTRTDSPPRSKNKNNAA